MADPMLRGTSTGYKPQFGQPLPRQTPVPGTFAGGLTKDYYGPRPGSTTPNIAALEAAYGGKSQYGTANIPPPAPTPPPTPTAGGGTAAMQGLAAAGGLGEALGVEDPMSALSFPAGLREGLGRRQYPTLANALAGLRY